MFEMLIAGFSAVLSLKIIALITCGVALGILFGAIPGLTATMAVALCLPMSFGMEPVQGMSLLMGLYIGGISGGADPGNSPEYSRNAFFHRYHF